MAKNRITRLQNQYTERQEANLHSQREWRKKVHIRRAGLILGVFCVLALVLGFQLWSAHRQLDRVNNQITTTQTTLKKKQAENKRLKKKMKMLKDPTYLQELIRTKYNYAKKGEILYNLVK